MPRAASSQEWDDTFLKVVHLCVEGSICEKLLLKKVKNASLSRSVDKVKIVHRCVRERKRKKKYYVQQTSNLKVQKI